jgi:predicted DsbA family dithiol-disulfide isomerase
MKVEIYSDIACPWCYIGKRRFDQALALFAENGDVDVVYRPFQLDPGAPTTSYPLMQRLEKKFGPRAPAMVQRVTEAGRSEGIDMRFGEALAANTFAAHRLLRLAEREHGAAMQHQVAERLFEAHFTLGLDIGDPHQLTELATSAGMDRARVAEYLRSNEGVEETRSEMREAQEMGITAVPTFVFDGRYAIQGGQPASVFLQALETVARERALAAAGSAGDACTDDSCLT